jgi:hypothetical protein
MNADFAQLMKRLPQYVELRQRRSDIGALEALQLAFNEEKPEYRGSERKVA